MLPTIRATTDVEPDDLDERDDDRREDRYGERVADDHGAREIPGLAIEHEAADRAGVVHRDESPPNGTGEATRAPQEKHRGDAAH